MANTFITPSVIARMGIATLYNDAVLAPLVWRDFDSDFRGKQGDAVTIRKPATFTAEAFDRNSGVTYQDATEDSATLTLSTLANVSFRVTDEQWTLDVSDFRAQLLQPAMEAIIQKVDGDIAEKLVDVGEANATSTWTSSSPRTVFTGETGAKAKLSRAKMPTSERYAVFSSEAAGVMLSDELFIAADKSGSTDGLREASIGKAFGFETYESQVLGYGSGDKGQADGVAFHKSAVILAVRPLDKPRGLPADQVAVESHKGLSLRVTYDYNHQYKQDEVSVDLLYGLATGRSTGAVQLSVGLGS